jgi:hypothetical protein
MKLSQICEMVAGNEQEWFVVLMTAQTRQLSFIHLAESDFSFQV